MFLEVMEEHFASNGLFKPNVGGGGRGGGGGDVSQELIEMMQAIVDKHAAAHGGSSERKLTMEQFMMFVKE